MAMNTWAAIDYGKVETIGLCHGVQHGWRQIADALGAEDPHDVEYICSGINHQTWYIDVRLRGRPIGRDELLAAFERHPVYSQQEKVRIDVLKRFGVYSTESNGHLSEYLPWYRKRPEEIGRWIDMSDWIHGETGGYLRYCTETRNYFETDFPVFLGLAKKPIDVAQRTDEHASHIIEALETGRVYRGHFNVKNSGVITNLPSDAIVESPGFVDRFGVNMVADLTLPLACAATCTASINVQRMAVEAAVKATSACSSSPCFTIPWSGRSAPRTKSGRWSTRCWSLRPLGCRNMRTRSPRRKTGSPRRRRERPSGGRRDTARPLGRGVARGAVQAAQIGRRRSCSRVRSKPPRRRRLRANRYPRRTFNVAIE